MKAIVRPATSGRSTHHEPVRRASGIKVQSSVQGGRLASNHNTSLSTARGLKVRSSVQGGRLAANHNQGIRRIV
jgi:hypothetical protein